MKTLMAGITLAAAVITQGAYAASTNYWYPNEKTLFSDNSGEYLINADGTYFDSLAADGTRLDQFGIAVDSSVDEGDSLWGIFNINTIEGVTSGLDDSLTDGAGFDELSGVFSLRVDKKYDLLEAMDGGGTCLSLVCFEFAPNTDFEDTHGAGAMIAFYTDPVYEYTRIGALGTQATLEALVTDGTLLMTAGFDGDAIADDFWVAGAVSEDISIVGETTLPSLGGSFNAGVDVLTNNSGVTFGEIDCLFTMSDICGSGSLLGIEGASTPFDAFNNVDFVMFRIPAPGSLALLGLGLLLLSRIRR